MTAPALTLDTIRPLVAEQRAVGRTLMVTFCCPQSGKRVQARWSAPQQSGVGSAVTSQAKRSAWYAMRRQVNVTLRSVLGHGAMASIATNVVNTAMGSGMTSSASTGLSASEQETGVVEAFKGVAGQFAWVGGAWVHTSAAKDLMSPFDAQLASHPITSAYDRQVLARMLVEVAGAEGGLDEEERLLLSDLLDASTSLETLVRRPPLTGAELGETTAGGTRVSMLATAWSVALCDEDLADAEVAALDRLADGLSLSAADRKRARDLACGYLIDQVLERVFTWGDHDASAREQLYRAGDKIGMTRAEIEQAEARFQKRKGL